MQQSTVTPSTSFSALNMHASRAVTAASVYSDGTVNALNMNAGPLSAPSLTGVDNNSNQYNML